MSDLPKIINATIEPAAVRHRVRCWLFVNGTARSLSDMDGGSARISAEVHRIADVPTLYLVYEINGKRAYTDPERCVRIGDCFIVPRGVMNIASHLHGVFVEFQALNAPQRVQVAA